MKPNAIARCQFSVGVSFDRGRRYGIGYGPSKRVAVRLSARREAVLAIVATLPFDARNEVYR